MQPSVLAITWPALLMLGYLLTVMFCRVLSARIDRELQVHERIRESRRLRLEYIQGLARARFKSVDFEE